MKSITVGFLSIAAAASAVAGSSDTSKDVSKDRVTQPVVESLCFRDHEFQVDLFGSYMNKPHTDRLEERGLEEGVNGGGGGVGVNYFFTRFAGLGVDGSVNSNIHCIWDYTAKVIVRFPIETGGFCLAPYIFGGGGGQSNGHTVGAFMCGGGVEYRATPRIGIFTEGRYTWTSHGNEGDNAQARLGIRIAF